MMNMGEILAGVGSGIASIMFVFAVFQQFFPYDLRRYIPRYGKKIFSGFYPYVQITFHEHSSDGFKRSTAFSAVQRYLAANSSTTAKRLKAETVKDSESVVLSMDDYEEITDEYGEVKLWWACSMTTMKQSSFSLYPQDSEKRYYVLTFHKRDREIVTKAYLSHVLKEGKAIAVKDRQRRLYTNNKSESYSRYSKTMWSHVVFEHPASFETLALEPKLKKDIMNDLMTFSKAKDYYDKVGKAWKRGYLLYGPPGTGKSTMVAAMANLMEYDIYDLELTSVKDNTELRKLLIETTGKSIIVIEDIDCSLDLTGQRKPKKSEDGEKDEKDPEKKAKDARPSSNDSSKVTLSGLLNFIDGLWSACGGERIIVFTTNYVEKLDPALIRRGRMDKHIELSYCSFEVFKVLAMNYLNVEKHHLFEAIEKLLGEAQMTPADVAENLMLKSVEDNADTCLECLITSLESEKEAARVKAEEEAKRNAEKEEKKKKKEAAELEKKEGVEEKKEETAKDETKKEAVEEKKKEETAEDTEVEESSIVSNDGVKENGVQENGRG